MCYYFRYIAAMMLMGTLYIKPFDRQWIAIYRSHGKRLYHLSVRESECVQRLLYIKTVIKSWQEADRKRVNMQYSLVQWHAQARKVWHRLRSTKTYLAILQRTYKRLSKKEQLFINLYKQHETYKAHIADVAARIAYYEKQPEVSLPKQSFLESAQKMYTIYRHEKKNIRKKIRIVEDALPTTKNIK